VLGRRVSIPYLGGLAALVVLTGIAFAFSYGQLAPIAGSDSPESVLLVIPLIAFGLIATKLAGVARHGDEAAVNFVFALPFLIVLAALLVWLPVKLSYFYWVYRVDLLAVPAFVAVAVIMLFGLPALFAARAAFLLLILGWPPVLDWVVRVVADPLATAQSWLVIVLLAPLSLGVHRAGQTFLFGSGPTASALTVSTACAGLVGVFSMALVAGFVALVARGNGKRKALWLGLAVLLALIGNVVRIAVLVAVAAHSGIHRALSLFHATSGLVLFVVFLVIVLLLLRPFGLEPPALGFDRAEPLGFRMRGLLPTVAVLVAIAVFTGWSTSSLGFHDPGLFRGVAAVTTRDLLGAPPGFSAAPPEPLPSFAQQFGSRSIAAVYHLKGSAGQEIAAQVVVDPSYRSVHRYGVLQCFVFHHYKVYSTHLVSLPGGGTASLIALRIDQHDVSTANWLQPVTIDGKRAWRRVILYQFIGNARAPGPQSHSSGVRALGLWLLNTLSPYGDSHPPARFVPAERGLTRLAGELTSGSV
jgi:exosortase